MSELFCFGFGYCASALARRLKGQGWRITGSTTSADGVSRLAGIGYQACLFDGSQPSSAVTAALASATHVLVSAPPQTFGDPVLRLHASDLIAAPRLTWIGYLSTIGVYGDHAGAWVDEDTLVHPVSERSQRRVEAEQAWLALGWRTGRRVQVFRLAGIYGPRRSPLDNVLGGTARRIVKPGQVFNRIHVDDIASVLAAAMAGRGSKAIYNVTDDEPAPPQNVVAFAAELLGLPPPPEIAFEAAGLSGMALSFYGENKRVRNDRLRSDLGVALAYPTYREGLRSLAGGS
ncbi:MAG: SDR family oxidoreductase [Hyphomicrobium sp.]